MTILWINLIIVYLLSFFSRYFAQRTNIGPTYIRPSIFLGFLLSCTLVLVSGLRSNIGDTYFYKLSYVNDDFKIGNIKLEGDFGFNFYQALLHMISDDPQILIFTTALITNALIVGVLYKYSRMIELSIFVYIASGMFTVSMNGMRQYFAAAIVFAATHFIMNGDWKKYISVVLLASIFHQSALILIPIYFLIRKPAWSKITLFLLSFAVMIVAGFNVISSTLFAAIENTQYGHYQEFAEGGASFLRVVVNSVPIIIAFVGRKKLRQLWPQSDYIVNLSLLNCVFFVIATQNWIFARLTIYFGLYNLILLSWIVKLFADSNKRLIYFTLIVCYFVYFYYEHVVALNINYKSNYFIF